MIAGTRLKQIEKQLDTLVKVAERKDKNPEKPIIKKQNFRRGQKVVCVHYKDKPVVIVDFVAHYAGKTEVWVRDIEPKIGAGLWWGPKSWFKKIRKGK